MIDALFQIVLLQAYLSMYGDVSAIIVSLTAQKHIDEILEPHVEPHIET